jgi:hypothetical protein
LLLTTQENTSVWRENAWTVRTLGSAGNGMPGVSLLGLKTRWLDVWHYSNTMLQAVAQQTLDHFALEGYDTAQEAYIVPDVDVRSSAPAVIRLYDAILRRLEDKTAAPPRLLPRLTNWQDAPLSPLLDVQQSMAKSAEHLGQMRQDYALSPSQREAVHHFLTLEAGEILAINGPPGTGKTTLLQSIVASLWVQAALTSTANRRSCLPLR